MKKSELLGKLATEFDEVGFPVINDSYFKNQRTKTYEVKVVRKSTETMCFSPQKILFYVRNDGEVDEEAFFVNKDPVNCDKFTEGLKTYLLTNPFEFTNYDIIKIVKEEEYAIIRAFSSSNGDIKEGKYFIFKDKDNFTYKPYTGTVETP